MTDPQRENDKLRRILDVSRYMAATTDLDILLGTIVEAACEVLECERATIFLFDRDTDELYSRVATGADEIRFPADRGIAGSAAQTRACINVSDAYTDDRFNPEIDKKTGYHTRNLLTFPLENLNGELTGVLQALNKHERPFDDDDEELARVLSAQAGVALHRWRLLAEHVEKQRMQRDLDIARDIQLALFPKKDPDVAGYQIAGWNRSADETGGDCYDFIPLDDGRLAILLADASGHGIGAALVIAQCRSLVRAMLSVTHDLQRIAVSVNNLLEHDLAEDHFVTAFLGLLDPQRHEIKYFACGQGPLMLVTPDGVENRNASDVPFAVISDYPFGEPSTFPLCPGATLVLLTDGFYETADSQMELFGEERVAAFVQRHATDTPEGLIHKLHQAVREFCNDGPQTDDLTAVLIRRNA